MKMNRNQGQQLMVYLFIALSVATAVLAYTIESWRWGGLAFTVGFFLIAIITLLSLRTKEGDEE